MLETTRGAEDPLRAGRVRDAMTTELVTCTAELPLDEVAALMVAHRIHSVVVLGLPGWEPRGAADWGVLSDLDLVAAAPWRRDVGGAGSVAASPRLVVRPDDSLEDVARLMAENATTHVLVAEPDGDAPAGILSALDVARALVPPPPPAPAPGSDDAVRPGDRLVIAAHQQGGPPRDAEVLEARGAGGGPPYLVRWQDSGRVSLHYPGSDARIDRVARRSG